MNPALMALLVALRVAALVSPQPPRQGPAQPQHTPAVKPSPPTRQPESAAIAKEVRVLEVDEKRANKVYRIRTAPGFQTVVEFPEDFASPPSCGDCADGSSEQLAQSPALFVIQAFGPERYIALKPLRYSQEEKGDGPPADEFLTTVTVRLKSLTLTLQVEYASRESADARVVFTLPNRAAETQYVRQQVAAARAAMEADFSRRLSESTTRFLLGAFVEAPVCRSLSRHQRQGDVRLEVLQLCRLGSKVFVRFAVENRGRTQLALGAVSLQRVLGKKGESVPVEDAQHFLSDDELDFREVAKGVVGFDVGQAEDGAASYSLHVTEKTGDGRDIVVSDFGF